MNQQIATMNNDKMTLDQINELKKEMQEMLELASLTKIRGSSDSLLCIERDQKLAIMGYSSEEIEDMCRPDKMDEVEFDIQFQQFCKEEERKLDQYNRSIKKQQKLDELREKCRAKYYP